MNNILPQDLINRLDELCKRADQRQQIFHTDFLTAENAAAIASRWNPPLESDYLFCGGYTNAERKILFFLPQWCTPDSFSIDSQISIIKLTPSDSKGISHRDYLGSLMSLGLKREKFGDILIFPTFCELFVFPELVNYLLSNLTHVGRTGVTVEEIPFSLLQVPEKHYTEYHDTIASLRLDNLVSSAFHISRNDASVAIQKNLVSVNHLLAEKPDKQIPNNAIIGLKGMGRVKIQTDFHTTKKGRIHIIFLKEE